MGTHGMTGAPVAAHINATGRIIPAFLPNVNSKFVRLWRKIKWERLTVDEDTLDAGSFECPECGEVIDFENAAVEEVVFDDEDDEDEKD